MCFFRYGMPVSDFIYCRTFPMIPQRPITRNGSPPRTKTTVVEGDIFHRVLSMHENARFEGCSRPEYAPPEQRSSISAESLNPLLRCRSLEAFDQKREIRGAPNRESKQGGGKGVQVFLAACLAILTIGILSHFALGAIQRPTGLAYANDGVRIDPNWMERSTQP
jgi:hypothetical protein